MNGTNIGSMPHIEPQKALDVILKYTPQIPAWPQLPKISFRENMYVQYSEQFPGIILEEQTEKFYVDTHKAFSGLEKFYENFLAGNKEYFGVSKQYAAGLYAMVETLGKNPAGVLALKGQCVGPITFAMMVKDTSDRAVFHDPQLRDVAVKQIIMKAAWQIDFLAENTGKDVIMFLDEPYLSAYGSAFTALSHDEVESALKETITGIKSAVSPGKVQIGVHCCGNTDWSLLLNSDIDILSFDAYEFFDNLLLYSEKIRGFIKRGGRLAWGLVPTSEDLISKETAESLSKRLIESLKKLEEKGINPSTLIEKSLLTPACGLGSRPVETAETALGFVAEIAKRFQR